MRLPRIVTASVAAVALAALPAAPVQAQTGQAQPALTPQAPAASAASPDFDGDGLADLAAGIFVDTPTDTWGVRIWYGSGRVSTIEPAALGAGGWDIYGPLLARDLNADGYTDLVFPSGRNERGARVTIALGSASGLDLQTARELVLSTSTKATTVALALVATPTPRLAVGLSEGAGSVALVDLDTAGAPVGSPMILRPGKGKLPKVSGSEAEFGASLAAWGSRLAIAAPYATVSGRRSAGAVVVATLSSKGVSSGRTITQATKGVTGAVGTLDRFGYSLAARDGYLAVGTPGDDVGRVKDSGSVQVFSLSGSVVKPIRRLTQASSGVPGKPERYDRFGAAVALGSTCSGVTSVIIGGSGEGILAEHERDGSAWLIPLRKVKGCAASQLYEGHGLGGVPTSGVRLGEFVQVLRDRGRSVDDVVIAGGGYYSEGPAGRIIRWSPTAGATFRFDELVSGVTGR